MSTRAPALNLSTSTPAPQLLSSTGTPSPQLPVSKASFAALASSVLVPEHKAPERIFDTKTLYCATTFADEGQIRPIINSVIEQYQKKVGRTIVCQHRINVVRNKEGNKIGVAFVFLTNPEIYFALINRNPDGTPRVSYVDDPTWCAPAGGNEQGWASINSLAEPALLGDWGDYMDEEDAYNKKVKEIAQSYICPKIAVPLQPLVTPPKYTLTPEQIEIKRSKIIEDNIGNPSFDQRKIVIPPTANVPFARAMVTPVDEKFMPNVLKASNVPASITEADLKILFTPYATDSVTPHIIIEHGIQKQITYPRVNISSGNAFIVFDPHTHDAQFALHMRKRTEIMTHDKNRVTLFFGHAYRTERDMSSSSASSASTERPPRSESTRGGRDGQGRGGQAGQGRGGQGRGGQGQGQWRDMPKKASAFDVLSVDDGDEDEDV